MVSAQQNKRCANGRSRSVPFAGLNVRRARGKWYVSTRQTPRVTFVKGFTGSREELTALLERHDIAEAIIASECGKRKTDKFTAIYRRAVAKRVFATCRKRAAAKGLDFTLTLDWLMDELERIEDRCSLTKLPFDYNARSLNAKWHKNPYAPSPDRVDRSVGYVPGNVRVILTSVNIAINEWGLSHLQLISRFLTPPRS